MTDSSETPGLARATESVDALAGQIVALREDTAARDAASSRRAKVWISVLGGGLLVTATIAVIALVVLVGTVGDVRASQEKIAAQQLADCEQNREFAGLGVLSQQVAATRTPRPTGTPTVSPVLGRIAGTSAQAYVNGGCVPVFGTLPPLPSVSATVSAGGG